MPTPDTLKINHLEDDWSNPVNLVKFAVVGTAAARVAAEDFRAQTKETLKIPVSEEENPLADWADYKE